MLNNGGFMSDALFQMKYKDFAYFKKYLLILKEKLVI